MMSENIRSSLIFELPETLKPITEKTSAVLEQVGKTNSAISGDIMPALIKIQATSRKLTPAAAPETLTETIEDLSSKVDLIQQAVAEKTYAEKTRLPMSNTNTPGHTLIICSNDKQKTSLQVMERVKSKVDARELGVGVERLRKAKNHKVILSCSSKNEAERVEKALKCDATDLVVEEVTKRCPLFIIRDLISINSASSFAASPKPG